MSLGNTFENDLLKLVFNGTAIANIADNAGTGPLTGLYVSLHIADPGEGGDQTTSEANYTNYARANVARTSGGWTVTADTVVNAANIDFNQCTGGASNVTHFGIGTNATTGAGKLLASGALTAQLNVSNLIVPQFAAGQLTGNIT